MTAVFSKRILVGTEDTHLSSIFSSSTGLIYCLFSLFIGRHVLIPFAHSACSPPFFLNTSICVTFYCKLCYSTRILLTWYIAFLTRTNEQDGDDEHILPPPLFFFLPQPVLSCCCRGRVQVTEFGIMHVHCWYVSFTLRFCWTTWTGHSPPVGLSISLLSQLRFEHLLPSR